jgi:glycosyltransferase involved in cell wall biosynthesis
MRLAFVSVMGADIWGGSEILWSKTANEALEKGHDVLTSTFDWGTTHTTLSELAIKGAKVTFRKNPFRKPIKLNTRQRLKQRLTRLFSRSSNDLDVISDFNPDLIIVNEGNTFDLFSFKKLYDFLRDKDVMLVHQSNKEFSVPSISVINEAQEFYKKVKRHIFVSRKNWEATEMQIACELPNSKVIFNPPSFDTIELDIYDKKLGDRVNFAVVARLDVNQKGHHLLFKMLAAQKWLARNWHLNLYGKGEYEPYLINLAKHFSIHDRVSFNGHVDDKSKIWKENHLLLLPSFYEGNPLVLVEALYHQIPAVVNDVGGCREVMIDNKTGYISEGFTSALFDEALERAWAGRKQWSNMGKIATEHMRAIMNDRPEELLLSEIESVLKCQ